MNKLRLVRCALVAMDDCLAECQRFAAKAKAACEAAERELNGHIYEDTPAGRMVYSAAGKSTATSRAQREPPNPTGSGGTRRRRKRC